jgi:hypothetical protein
MRGLRDGEYIQPSLMGALVMLKVAAPASSDGGASSETIASLNSKLDAINAKIDRIIAAERIP